MSDSTDGTERKIIKRGLSSGTEDEWKKSTILLNRFTVVFSFSIAIFLTSWALSNDAFANLPIWYVLPPLFIFFTASTTYAITMWNSDEPLKMNLWSATKIMFSLRGVGGVINLCLVVFMFSIALGTLTIISPLKALVIFITTALSNNFIFSIIEWQRLTLGQKSVKIYVIPLMLATAAIDLFVVLV